MEKLDPKTDGATPDIVEQNIDKMKALFPDVFIEGKVDLDALRETLGDYADERQERYSFTWNGKARARRIAQTPSTGTLRPCPEESVNWDTTQNLFIEGDNLEVLKLLQKSYHKKVKMIYIDPPYNTGGEFIYPDKYQDNLQTYLRYTGQVDEEGLKLSANAETSGRYHTNWLNMMYPRLKLARNLLQDDGVIFISIDDCEAANLRKLCDEIFGEENFISSIMRKRKKEISSDTKNVAVQGEYILAYGKSDSTEFLSEPLSENYVAQSYRDPTNQFPDGKWRPVPITVSKGLKGGGYEYSISTPAGKVHDRLWAYPKKGYEELLKNRRIYFGVNEDGVPQRVIYAHESKGQPTSNYWHLSPTNKEGKKEILALFGENVFDTPKPTRLVAKLINLVSHSDDIILDFFAGSCPAAHAVMQCNSEGDKNRKFIMVQLPEPVDQTTAAGKTALSLGYKTISDVGKERIRRVIKKLEEERAEKAKETQNSLIKDSEDTPEPDLGFKVFKLDASNIKPWDADFDNLEIALFDAVDNIKPDRSEADVLYELLLKYGVDLAMPIEERKIAGKTVYIIGAGALIVCLDKKISLDVVEGIADLKEELKPEVMRVVFTDSGFADDVVKTNAVQILRQAEIEDVRSL